MLNRRFSSLLAVSVAVAGACADQNRGEHAALPPLERDSAGIRIIESDSTNADVARWQLDTTAIIRIGAVDGDAAYLLDRVGDVLRLTDGTIVAVNGSSELRFYDATGQHVRTVGRKGKGPGEFQQIGGAVLARDTLFVFDADMSRVSFWSVAGDYLNSLPPRPELHAIISPRPRLAAVSTDGRFVFLAHSRRIPRREPTELFWDTVPNIVLTRDGARVDSLGVSGMQWVTGERQIFPPPFRRTSSAAADSLHVVVTHGERYEIEIWNISTGRLEHTRQVRRPSCR